MVDHGLEHLRRGDHRLSALERAPDDPLLQKRDQRGADLHSEVPARHHHRICLGEDVLERVDCLRFLDLRDHVRGRAVLVDERLQVAHVRSGADEGQRDVVDAELEGEVEVLEVLPRQRRDRNRDAGEIDALVGRHRPADDHAAARTPGDHLLDPQPDVAVVDQHLVTRSQDLADRRGRDLELAVVRLQAVAADDRHLRPLLQHDGRIEVPNSELRSLKVADEGDRLARALLCVANELRGPGVVVVRAVREVEARRVHARVDQSAHPLGRCRRRPDRGDDLRAAWRGTGHLS